MAPSEICANSFGIEVIPGVLHWAAEHDLPNDDVVEGKLLKALDLCQHAGGKVAAYSVMHYAPQAVGSAFGPLDLGALLHFCRGLDQALADASGTVVVLTTPKGDRAYRMNAAVMLGAYLTVRHAWTPVQLAKTLATEATAKFICAWSRIEIPEQERAMTVKDCWGGLALAMRRQWLEESTARDDLKLEAAVARYNLRAMCYDATWIVPGMIMVTADPTTVVYDPNPATCKNMFPSHLNGGQRRDHANGLFSPARRSGVSDRSSGSQGNVPIGRGSAAETICTVDTVDKAYGEDYSNLLPLEAGVAPGDYVTFMELSGVGIVVRANFDDESGMPTKSYADDAFRPYGIEQANIRIVDVHPGLPKPADVRKLIAVTEGFACTQGSQAVLIHCKGGFGRSIVLACCLAMYRLDVPGSDLLGWVRIARPGTVNTPLQEAFLKSMRGQKDVMTYAQMGRAEEQAGAAKASCAGCSVQ